MGDGCSISEWCIENESGETRSRCICTIDSIIGFFSDTDQTRAWRKQHRSRRRSVSCRRVEDQSGSIRYLLMACNTSIIPSLPVVDTDHARTVEQQHRDRWSSASKWSIEDQSGETGYSLLSLCDNDTDICQTLEVLNLEKNKINQTGARFLAEALKINRVRLDLVESGNLGNVLTLYRHSPHCSWISMRFVAKVSSILFMHWKSIKWEETLLCLSLNCDSLCW